MTSQPDWMLRILVIFILVLALAYVTALFIDIFKPNNSELTIEVVGIVDDIEGDTITSLHKECIEFCVRKISNERGTLINNCWEQCEKLGKGLCEEVKE